MPYRVRFTTPEDVPQCAALSRDAPVLSTSDNLRRVNRWRKWLTDGYANSAVVVDEADDVVAFGLSVCISDGLFGQVRNGYHHTEHYLQRSDDYVLAPSQVIKAHRGEGVNLLGFYGWRTDLPPEEAEQVSWLLLRSFLHLHRGLHLKSFTKEIYGEEEMQGYQRMGCRVFRTPEQFPYDTRRKEPYIVGADRGSVQQAEHVPTYMYDMFRHDAPALQLERSQLELVQLAYLLGLSDEEILEIPEMQPKPREKKDAATADAQAEQEEGKNNKQDTALSLLRQRWCRVYEKVDSQGIEWRHFGRNNKRHDLLQFVERHREVAFPLLIGRYLHRHPELARRFPIPVD